MLAAADQRRGGPQLLAVPIAEADQLLSLQLDGGARQRRHARQRLVGGPPAQRVQARLEHGALLLQPVPPVDDPGDLRLQPDHRLLQALTRGVAGAGERFVVLQQGALFAGEAQRGVRVAELEVRLLHLRDDVPLVRLVHVVQRRCLLQRHLAPQVERAEPGKGLAHGEAVELRTDPRLHAPQRLRERQDGVGQRRDLRNPLAGGAVACPGFQDGRVELERARHVGPQLRRGGMEVRRRRRLGGLGGRHRRKKARRGNAGRGASSE